MLTFLCLLVRQPNRFLKILRVRQSEISTETLLKCSSKYLKSIRCFILNVKKFWNLIWVLNGGIFLACTYRKIASFSTLTKHFWPSLLRNNQWFFLEMQSDSKIYDAFLVDKFSRACAYHRIACVITSWENWSTKNQKTEKRYKF